MEDIELVNNEIDKELESLIFQEMCKIEGIQDYLRSVMANDIKRYFVAPKEQQEYLKGSYDRTMQLLAKIQKSSPVDNNK